MRRWASPEPGAFPGIVAVLTVPRRRLPIGQVTAKEISIQHNVFLVDY